MARHIWTFAMSLILSNFQSLLTRGILFCSSPLCQGPHGDQPPQLQHTINFFSPSLPMEYHCDISRFSRNQIHLQTPAPMSMIHSKYLRRKEILIVVTLGGADSYTRQMYIWGTSISIQTLNLIQ